MKKKTEAKRQAIVDVAAAVFREVGFERASMSEICRRVGGSKATIYNYFPSKERLFFEVMHQANDAEFLAVHQQLDHASEDIADALRSFGVGFLKMVYSPDIMAARRLVVSNFGDVELGRSCYELGPKRSKQEMSEFLRSAIDKGTLRPCDPQVASLHLRGLLDAELQDSFSFRIESDMSQQSIEGIVERAVAVFMAAYGVSPAKA